MTLNHVRERVERLVAPLLLSKGEEEVRHLVDLSYQPLENRKIRMIALALGKWEDEIECNLKTVFLDDDPSYETLSYF